MEKQIYIETEEGLEKLTEFAMLQSALMVAEGYSKESIVLVGEFLIGEGSREDMELALFCIEKRLAIFESRLIDKENLV